MFESKYSKLLTVLLILGIISIVAILGTTGIIIMNNGKAKQEAENAVDNFQNIINEEVNNNNNNSNNNINEEIPESNIIANEIAPTIGLENIIVDNTSSEENTKNYKGFPMVGTIEIPAINLKYPVLEDSSRDAIEVAVGIYDGPGLNKVGVTTIAGHNYRDGRFFANNKKLVEGDKIYITDINGQKITYSIYKIYTTSPEDGSHLDYDTQGKREIALSTCTDDTKSRLIILAKEQ